MLYKYGKIIYISYVHLKKFELRIIIITFKIY